jgi:flagellar motor switch protein FliG
MAVGPDAAARLTGQLTPDEAEAVALEVAQMDRVPPETTEAVLSRVARGHARRRVAHHRRVEYARDVLERVYGKTEAEQILRASRRSSPTRRGCTGCAAPTRSSWPRRCAASTRRRPALVLAHLDRRTSRASCASCRRRSPATSCTAWRAWRR